MSTGLSIEAVVSTPTTNYLGVLNLTVAIYIQVIQMIFHCKYWNYSVWFSCFLSRYSGNPSLGDQSAPGPASKRSNSG